MIMSSMVKESRQPAVQLTMGVALYIIWRGPGAGISDMSCITDNCNTILLEYV